MYARGKLGVDIKLLVAPEVKACIDLIMKLREKAGISNLNRYLFGLPGTPVKPVRHCDAYILLCRYAKKCGAKNHKLLRATKMRSQLATACMKLNLDDAGVGDLARYMGHHVNIHRTHYRKYLDERDVPIFLKFISTAMETDEDGEKPQQKSNKTGM